MKFMLIKKCMNNLIEIDDTFTTFQNILLDTELLLEER